MGRNIVPRSERFSPFHTEIDEIDTENERLIIRGVDLEELIMQKDFVEVIYHTLLNKKPTDAEKRLLNASLVSIHTGHQVIPPTIHAPRVAASTGAGVAQCLTAGFASSGDMHLGAIRHAMEDYRSLAELVKPDSVYEDTRRIIQEKLQEREMICGFGHPYMDKDPRPEPLRELVQSLGYETIFMTMYDAVRDEFYESKGKLANVDGINGAILLSLGFEPEHGEGLFLLSRGIGMLAHISEEYKLPAWSAWSSLIARNNIPGLAKRYQE